MISNTIVVIKQKLIMKRKNSLKYLTAIIGVFLTMLLLSACELFDFEETKANCDSNCDKEHVKSDGTKYSTLEAYFADGFTMQLEQIYLMQGKHNIPIMDEPVAESFTNNQNIVNIPGFVAYDKHELIFCGLQKGDKWTFGEMSFVEKTNWIESGYGGSYLLRSYTVKTPYSIITSNSPYNKLNFVTSIDLNGVNYRNGDDYQMIIQSYNSSVGEYMRSNLVLTVVTDVKNGGNGIIDGYIYLNTNAQVSMTQTVTQPLTGEQVRQIVNSGSGFEVYQKYGHNCIKIGTNLYIPTIGNTYKYIGTSNDNGMINGYSYKYYQLKFKIIK